MGPMLAGEQAWRFVNRQLPLNYSKVQIQNQINYFAIESKLA